jgi:protein-tyrosine phosphatase
MAAKVSVCFVCLGNICRSPTAEGVMRRLVTDAGLGEVIDVSSAGTGDYHVGERPDERAREAARRRGITLASRARQFEPSDWDRFDYVVPMDRSNLKELGKSAPSKAVLSKARLLRSFDPESPPDAAVPDPYYGGDDGFDTVLDLCDAACRGLLEHIRRERGL